MELRTFEHAVAYLKKRIRSSRPTDSNRPKASFPNGTPSLKGTPPLSGMREWLQQLGHPASKVDGLNIIHIAGTKGKGSTCAFVESLLRAHGQRVSFPLKTGLYTSPHLLDITERIRINFRPLPPAVFAKYVFEVCDRLSIWGKDGEPRFLQLLALISFHTFLREDVDVAIYETHHGGEYDATNVVENPVVTAITSIGVDHILDLGPTIENIAWHKAGIFKRGAAAISVPQEQNVSVILQDRADEKQVSLHFVSDDHNLPGDFESDVQRLNCSLARAISDEFLRRAAPDGQPRRLSQQDITDGIRQFNWPGRFQFVKDGNITWLLDGAHNELSITKATDWFERTSLRSAQLLEPAMRIVLFAQQSTARDGEGVVRRLAESLYGPIDHVIFTTYHTDKSKYSKEDELTLRRYHEIWKSIKPTGTTVWTAACVQEAIRTARENAGAANTTHILVTGSLYLVGATLGSLQC
ncbi:folylpolyglutamate synthase [Diaporthe sp. PMI_573]|nr:folylpolyglutamate synthase [Diaporthaceae sp. PMI_573]